MANVTLGFDELESGRLPRVCMQCGRRRDVDYIERKFVWNPLLAPPLYRMIRTKRLVADIPLCPAHGGWRLGGYPRWHWWGMQTVAIDRDRITIGRVHQDFIEALQRWRVKRRQGETEEPPRRKVQVGRGVGGGMATLKVLGILVVGMVGLVGFMTCGMVVVMGLATLRMTSMPTPSPPLPQQTAGPAVNEEVPPERIIVGLVGVTPAAGFPGALPWAPLAQCTRLEMPHFLDDAELNKALADLKSMDPNAVIRGAKQLAKALPTPARRKEIALALQAALGNPFPEAKEAAAEGLGVWGTRDNVPGLIEMLADINPNSRAAAMTALAALKDEQGAVAVAQRLTDFFDQAKARQALTAMGTVAEKAVLPLLNNPDPQTRSEACGVLGAVGTKQSLPELEKVSHDPNPAVAQAAEAAIREIKERIRNSSEMVPKE